MPIQNPTFDEADSRPGLARFWTLGSHVSGQAYAEFLPGEGLESFERFAAFVGALEDASERRFFELLGADSFELGWLRVPHRSELGPAERAPHAFDGASTERFGWSAWRDAWEATPVSRPIADAFEAAWPGTDDFAPSLDEVPRAFAELDGGLTTERFDSGWPELGR